ncbi:MAG: stage II sporulation protein R [Hungatella sp.]|nr:stage II sporulation protein R [Hungatella sp.]
MKYQKTLLMSASCFLLALLCLVVWGYQKDRDLAGRIAPEILRFHVLANSNSSSDQQIKTDLKSFLLETMQSCPASSKEELSSYINEHTEAFEEKANAYLSQKGVGYRAHIRVTQAYFPTKAYGDLVLPCGTYDTVQVTLGEGRGRNWWCVLYPRLCFIDATHSILPESSRQELQFLLSEEDYRALFKEPVQIHIRLKLLQFFDGTP